MPKQFDNAEFDDFVNDNANFYQNDNKKRNDLLLSLINATVENEITTKQRDDALTTLKTALQTPQNKLNIDDEYQAALKFYENNSPTGNNQIDNLMDVFNQNTNQTPSTTNPSRSKGEQNRKALNKFKRKELTPEKMNKKLSVSDVLRALMYIEDLTHHVYYDVDRNSIMADMDIEIDTSDKMDKYILHEGELDLDTDVDTLRIYLSRMELKASTDDVRSSLIRISHFNEKRLTKTTIQGMIDKGHYDADVYRKVMIDWLQCIDEGYTYAWLKSLLYAIKTHQFYEGTVSGFNAVPYRFTAFGAQGIGKSKFFDLISGGSNWEPNVGDKNFSFKDTDNAAMLSRSVLANLDDSAYGSTMNGMDDVKSIITDSKVSYRPKYARSYKDAIKRAVIVGSTNRAYAFNDPTGSRRELPLEFAVSMTSEEATAHGTDMLSKLFDWDNKRNLDLIYNLWATFVKDQEDENKRIIPMREFNGDTELNAARKAYVQRHSKNNLWGDAVQSVLEIQVPSRFFETKNLTNNERVDILVQLYDDGKLSGLQKWIRVYNELAASDKLIQIGLFDKIPATVLNKTVRGIASANDHGSYVNVIGENMAQQGFTLKRSRTYEKIDADKLNILLAPDDSNLTGTQKVKKAGDDLVN